MVQCQLYWRWERVADSNDYLAELCFVPVAIVSVLVTLPTPLADVELSPGDAADGCITRAHPEYDNSRNYPTCAQVFGNSGQFPQPPSSYVQGRPVQVVPQTDVSDISFDFFPSVSSSRGRKHGLLWAGATGLFAYVLNDRYAPLFKFKPHVEILHDNGVSYYGYGSQVHFSANEWAGYWKVFQNNSDGQTQDWVYSTGVTWQDGVFSASYDNISRGYESDTLFALSARKSWGAWTWQSAYTADWQIQGLNHVWDYQLNFGAIVVIDKWTISPTTELLWRNGNIGDDAKIRVDLRRDF